MRKETNKFLFRLTVCALSVLATTSCSKDEFFGIEEAQLIDETTMLAIATSEEYYEYEMACLYFMEELNDIDTSKMHVYTVINGKPIYVKSGSDSYKNVLKHKENLMKIYPELLHASVIELKQIQNIALSKNNTLREHTMKVSPFLIKRTKSGNDEAHAWLQHVSSSTYNWGYEHNWDTGAYTNTTEYGEYTFHFDLQVYENSIEAVNQARNKSISTEKEVGGLAWNDASAVTVFNREAGPYYMYWPRTDGSPYPTYDFHFHPSGDLTPSELDRQFWNNHYRVHYIFDWLGNFEIYYGNFL